MLFTRAPRPALRPFVSRLWASSIDLRQEPSGSRESGSRERVLPTGNSHLAIRLEGPALKIYRDGDDTVGRSFDRAIVGGPRTHAYLRDVSAPVASVGAQLESGAAAILFGVPVDELAGSHTSVDALWGAQTRELVDELRDTGDPAQRLDVLERFLGQRLPRVRGVHPAVAYALERFSGAVPIRDVVDETGLSHRRFVTLFSRQIGLTPKRFCRVRRFQQALVHLARGDAPTARVAVDSGYFDQPHFNREFREMAGISPGAYRAIGPSSPNHVPVALVRG